MSVFYIVPNLPRYLKILICRKTDKPNLKKDDTVWTKLYLVLERGLEPLHLSVLDFESSVSADFTTPAYGGM